MAYFKSTSANGLVTYHSGGVPPKGATEIDAAEHAAATALRLPTGMSLLRYAAGICAQRLATPQSFGLGADAALQVWSDATDATMIDLHGLWCFGVIHPTATRTWPDARGGRPALTGAQGVALAAAVDAWRADVKLFAATTAAAITAGTYTTAAQIDALSWPAP